MTLIDWIGLIFSIPGTLAALVQLGIWSYHGIEAKTAGRRATAPGAHKKDKQHEIIRRACERLTHDAVQLYHDIEVLDEHEQRAAIAESLQRVEEQEALLKIASILERVLKLRAAPRTKKPAGAH